MTSAHQSEEDLTPEMLNPPIGWEEIEEQKRIERSLEYTLSLTPSQRLARLEEASNVAARLSAVAEKYGVQMLGWRVTGPSLRQIRVAGSSR